MMEIRAIDTGDQRAMDRFLERIPEGDRTFFKEDVADPAVVDAWFRPGAARSIAVDDGEVIGYVAVVPLQGWSSHVGEVRVIVDPSQRGKGVGRALAQRAIFEALELCLTKMVVEVIAERESTVNMFRSLGFDPEAVLADHVRDRSGELRDLMVLAHSVDAAAGALQMAGLSTELN
jgi:L-amino acid N-acyltransferase YncA